MDLHLTEKNNHFYSNGYVGVHTHNRLIFYKAIEAGYLFIDDVDTWSDDTRTCLEIINDYWYTVCSKNREYIQ